MSVVQAPVPETTESRGLQDALERLCEQHRLVAVYVFGSRAIEIAARFRNESPSVEYPASDVDIGVLPARRNVLSLDEKVCLATELEDLLGVGRVDLVALPDADAFLAANVVRGERLYALDEYLADEYDLYALRRAGDLAPLERERMAMILGEQV